MKTDPEAVAARARLGTTEAIAAQMYCLAMAVRALIASHPDPDRMRQTFDQLLFQTLTHPANLADPDVGIVMQDLAATLFEPPVRLDT